MNLKERLCVSAYILSFVGFTIFAVLPYMNVVAVDAETEAALLQDRARLAAALETIHNSPEMLMKIVPVEGAQAGQIVVLTDDMGRETQIDTKFINWDRWCGTEVELAFERAQKITGLNRQELRVLAADPEKYNQL